MNTPFIWRIVLVLGALLVCVLLALWLPSILSPMPTEAQRPSSDQRRKKPPPDQRQEKPPPDQRQSERPQRETDRFGDELDALRKQHAELRERYEKDMLANRSEMVKLKAENRILTAKLEAIEEDFGELLKSRLQAIVALNTSEQVQKHLAAQLSHQVAELKKMLETLLSEQKKGAKPTPPGEDPFAPRPQ